MSNQQVKCRNCGKLIDKSSAYHVGKASYYCNESCFNTKKSKQISNKVKYAPKSDNSRKQMTDYILSLYLKQGYDKSEIPWELMMQQVKLLLKEHSDWRYSGITYTLHYMVDIKEINLFADGFNGSILNLVGYEYENAKKYYAKMQNIKYEIESSKIDDKVIIVRKNVKEKDEFAI